MKFTNTIILSLLSFFNEYPHTDAFISGRTGRNVLSTKKATTAQRNTALSVSIGLGPDAEEEQKANQEVDEIKEPLVEPDHELEELGRH